MPVTERDIKNLLPTDKKQSISLGSSLYLVVNSINQGGTIGFVGRSRFPPGRKGKPVEVRIGTYGKGVGQWNLRDAKKEWDRIRLWAYENKRDPRDLYKQERGLLLPEKKRHTFKEAVEGFMERTKHAASTKKDYWNKLNNQVIPVLGADTSLQTLEWSEGGREKVLKMKMDIEKRGSGSQSDRVLLITRMVFDYAIDMGWMDPPNTAVSSRSSKSDHVRKNNPSLTWDQLPKFFDDLEGEREDKSPIVIAAVQLTMLTFLRVGSLVGGKWSEVNEERGLWVIPKERMKGGVEHEVPLTPQIKQVLEVLYQYNGNNNYIFYSPRGKKFEHIHPSAINVLLVRMGYKDITTAHGMRSTALTCGQEQLGFEEKLIRRQMAHIVTDKIGAAYDKTKFIKERTEFMESWSKAMVDRGMKIK